VIAGVVPFPFAQYPNAALVVLILSYLYLSAALASERQRSPSAKTVVESQRSVSWDFKLRGILHSVKSDESMYAKRVII
jgi:hypothetical protein